MRILRPPCSCAAEQAEVFPQWPWWTGGLGRKPGFYPHKMVFLRSSLQENTRSHLIWYRSASGYRGSGEQLARAFDLVADSMSNEELSTIKEGFWYDWLWQQSKRENEISNGFTHIGGFYASIGAALDDPVLYQFGVDMHKQFVENGFTIDGQVQHGAPGRVAAALHSKVAPFTLSMWNIRGVHMLLLSSRPCLHQYVEGATSYVEPVCRQIIEDNDKIRNLQYQFPAGWSNPFTGSFLDETAQVSA